MTAPADCMSDSISWRLNVLDHLDFAKETTISKASNLVISFANSAGLQPHLAFRGKLITSECQRSKQ